MHVAYIMSGAYLTVCNVPHVQMSPIPPICSQDKLVVLDIPKNDSRDCDVYKHMKMTQPSMHELERICHFKRLLNKSQYNIFLHRFAERLIENKSNLFLADPEVRIVSHESKNKVASKKPGSIFEDMSKPSFVYGLHVVNMKNVKKIILRHLAEGILFTKEISNDELYADINIPLAVESEPNNIFVAKNKERVYCSAIPTCYGMYLVNSR